MCLYLHISNLYCIEIPRRIVPRRFRDQIITLRSYISHMSRAPLFQSVWRHEWYGSFVFIAAECWKKSLKNISNTISFFLFHFSLFPFSFVLLLHVFMDMPSRIIILSHIKIMLQSPARASIIDAEKTNFFLVLLPLSILIAWCTNISSVAYSFSSVT